MIALMLAVVAAGSIGLAQLPAHAGPYKRLGHELITSSYATEEIFFWSRTGWVDVYVRCAGAPGDPYGARWAEVAIVKDIANPGSPKYYNVRCDGLDHKISRIAVPKGTRMYADITTRTSPGGPLGDPIGYGYSVWGDGEPIG
jgi:hypothetical protein